MSRPKRLSVNAPQPKEAALQKACCQWLAIQQAQGHLKFFAVPNGGTRHVREAVNLKRQGVMAGVPDLVVITKGTVLFFELKRPGSKGQLKGEQLVWQNWLRDCGYLHMVIRDVETLRIIVLDAMEPK